MTTKDPTPADAGNSIACKCSRCSHAWQATARRPKHCPACGASHWWQAMKETAAIPTLYFDGGAKGGGWILQTKPDRFIFADSASVKLHFKAAGVHLMPGLGNLTREEHEMHQAQLHRCVDYAGPLAGYKPGIHRLTSGQIVIVTQGANIPPAKKGSWDDLGEYLATLLAPHDKQLDFVLCWLALARQSLLRGDFRPAQLLALGGPGGGGKTFFQVLVKRLLGGRGAMPYDYMTGKTAFNQDLAEAEHLSMDDQSTSTRFEDRRKLGAHIKQFTVGEDFRIHPKGRKALSLPTFRRLTVCFNNEAENVAVLPPLDESLAGKVLLIQTGYGKLHEDRIKNEEMLNRDLPGFCHFLDNYKVPARLKKAGVCPCSLCAHDEADADVRRFGFRTFHHPALIEVLTSISPEQSLWSIIKQAFTGRELPEGVFEGTSEEIEIEICKTPFANSLASLRTFPGAVGTYLGRLAGKRDGRVFKTTRQGINVWHLHPKNA